MKPFLPLTLLVVIFSVLLVACEGAVPMTNHKQTQNERLKQHDYES